MAVAALGIRLGVGCLAGLRVGVVEAVKVGAHGSHGSIATVTLAGLPADQREVVAGEVHTLLAPFVMRHEVVQA